MSGDALVSGVVESLPTLALVLAWLAVSASVGSMMAAAGLRRRVAGLERERRTWWRKPPPAPVRVVVWTGSRIPTREEIAGLAERHGAWLGVIRTPRGWVVTAPGSTPAPLG